VLLDLVFTGHTQQLVVQLGAEEKGRLEKLVEFRSNGLDRAGALRFQQESERALSR